MTDNCLKYILGLLINQNSSKRKMIYWTKSLLSNAKTVAGNFIKYAFCTMNQFGEAGNYYIQNT